MPANSAASPSGRSRTPPELKWLLNERAALAGQLSLWSEEITVLGNRIVHLQQLLQARQSQLLSLSAGQADLSARIAALDRTIELGFPVANPAAAGVVRAWAGRYGERGALTAFLRDRMREICPAEVSLAELQRLVVARFGLVLGTPRERERLKRSISTRLRDLRDKHGLLVSRDNWVGRANQPVWSWKQPETLDDLRRSASHPASPTESVSHDRAPNSDASRVEVAGQRARDAGR